MKTTVLPVDPLATLDVVEVNVPAPSDALTVIEGDEAMLARVSPENVVSCVVQAPAPVVDVTVAPSDAVQIPVVAP